MMIVIEELHLILKTETCTFALIKQETNAVKFLGIYTDTKLSWNNQIAFATRRIAKLAGPTAALTSYFGLFHITLPYGFLGWRNACISHLQRLSVLQKAAERSIVSAPYDEYCRPIFKN